MVVACRLLLPCPNALCRGRALGESDWWIMASSTTSLILSRYVVPQQELALATMYFGRYEEVAVVKSHWRVSRRVEG